MSTFSLILFIIIGGAGAAFKIWYNTPQRKGKRGENRVIKHLQALPQDYHIVNDVVFETKRGTTQIDHIVVSKYGVFTIETKNYRGDIYGDDDRKEWTQIIVTRVRYNRNWYKVYKYVTKKQFYNPVKQSVGHAIEIEKQLRVFCKVSVVPIVAFSLNANLSNVSSRYPVVYDYQLPSLLQSYNTIFLTDEEVIKIVDIISCNNKRKIIDNKTHVKNLRDSKRREKDKINNGICPRCEGTLVLRKGKYGDFYGCSNYPNCKFTVSC